MDVEWYVQENKKKKKKKKNKQTQTKQTKGPLEYVPPIEVTVLERRKAIPLDINDG